MALIACPYGLLSFTICCIAIHLPFIFFVVLIFAMSNPLSPLRHLASPTIPLERTQSPVLSEVLSPAIPHEYPQSLSVLSSTSCASSLPASRSGGRKRAPPKRHVPQEDPRRRSLTDRRSHNRRQQGYRAARATARGGKPRHHPRRIASIVTATSTLRKVSPSQGNCYYLPHDAGYSSQGSCDDPIDAIVVSTAQSRPQGKQPSFDPSNWVIDSDDDILDTKYVDDICDYARRSTEALARKRLQKYRN